MKTPKLEATVTSTKLHIIIPATLGGVVIVIFLAVWFQDQFAILILVVTVGIGGLLFAKFAGKSIEAGIKWQDFRFARANADKAEAEAEAIRLAISLGSNGVMIRRDKRYVYYPPTATERQALASGQVIEGETTNREPLDFFVAMLGTKQPYKIIAEQRRGKSYSAMHVSDRATIERGACVVIGTKWELGEWPNAVRFLVDPERVAYGLRKVIDEVVSRHQTHRRGPIIRVFLDDWINTVIQHGPLALEFLDLASTTMVSAGIVPYFLLQGDGNDDWGSRRSAMLKNNFTGLFITGPRDERGDPIPELNTAVLKYPGSRDEYPVRLPRGLPRLGVSRLPEPRVRQPEPSDEEQRVLEMHAAGESYRQITLAVWGKVGAYYNDKVNEIVRRNGGEA